jgi:hypothetical protein
MTEMPENSLTPEEFQKVFANMGNVHVLEEELPIEVQQEFMELSSKLEASEYADETAMEMGQRLSDPALTEQEIKETLVILAFRGWVDAFRTIEKYCEVAPHYLHEFARFAYHISKVFVESELTDTMPRFVSSGLGGKGSLLRYCVVVFPSLSPGFTETQQKVIELEFKEATQRIGGETEQTRFLFEYAFMKVLVPIQTNLNIVIKEAISECNKYGDFVYEGYFATNVRTPGHLEILDVIRDLKAKEPK